MIKIRQLSGLDIKTLHKTFQAAFSDYVETFNISVDQLKYLIERRGCNLNLSFGAYHKDDLVGFTLNGVGDWNGKLTAYDTGTGIIKDFRNRGIATKIFKESIPVLKQYKIQQYLLEVIKINRSAFDLYKKAGFTVVREFDYYTFGKSEIKPPGRSLSSDYEIRQMIELNWSLAKSMWDFYPSWQNSIDSIQRKIKYFTFLGLFHRDEMVGYGCIEKHTGDIPQISVHPDYRRKGLGLNLFYELIKQSDSSNLKLINCCTSSDSFKQLTAALGLKAGHGQYEMILEL